MLKLIAYLCVCMLGLMLVYIISPRSKDNCDNIGNVCYSANRYLPIDVVYTWVNGSDPLLQQSVEVYKKLYSNSNHDKKQNDSSNNTIVKKLKIFTGRSLLSIAEKQSDTASNVADNPFQVPKECPIDGCIVSPAVVSSSYIPSSTFSIDEIQQFVGFSSTLEIKYAKPENAEDSTLLFIKFASVSEAKLASGRIITHGTLTVKFRPVFYSLEHGEGPYVKTSSKLIDISSCKIDNTKDLSGVLSYDQTQSMLCVDKDALWNVQQKCRGVQGRDTYLVWPPWEKYMIGQLSIQDVGAHRFADNEELRYSLRSLYQFAPWVRNIYILTNGQVPSWLNVHHNRIKVVTHSEVFHNGSHLPTFSSPAIEANMHHILGLSEHFLYFNDDVFLGRHVYPEDFVSTEGYKVFLAWNIPNCNTGCPANWLTDGYCDLACNVSACNFDGGDCLPGSPSVAKMVNNIMNNVQPGAASFGLNYCNPGCSPSWVGDKYCDPACNVDKCSFDAGDCGTKDIKSKVFEVKLASTANNTNIDVPVGVTAMYFNVSLQNETVDSASFETTDDNIVRTSVLSLPHKIISLTFFPNKTQVVTVSFLLNELTCQKVTLNIDTSPSTKPYVKPEPADISAQGSILKEQWEIPESEDMQFNSDFGKSVAEIMDSVDTKELSVEAQKIDENLVRLVEGGLLTDKGRWVKLGQFLANEKSEEADIPQRKIQTAELLPQRLLLDTFADSLHHVNNLYTLQFGKAQRKVLSHMPFLVNKTILSDLQSRFPKQFNKTSSNKFRSSDDMQFSFSYYYFIIHATHRPSTAEFLREVDVDGNDEYSTGELNILMTRIFDLPLSETNRSLFWDTLENCSVSHKISNFGPQNITVCANLSSLIDKSIQNVTTYKHEIVDDKDVTFKMLKSNSTKVRIDLDYVRGVPKKFICLNDNMDHGSSYEHAENMKMLAELYQTVFPNPSPFEHPPGLVNRYLYKSELETYLQYQYSSFYISLSFIPIICLFYACYLKRRSMCRFLKGKLLFRFMT